ncbi:hypothetical protein AAMO2058_000707100 [Amorphochlora amoebiformis]
MSEAKINENGVSEDAIEDAEEGLKQSKEMAIKRKEFLEQSNLHLKNIAQQIQEMERKGKQEIDIHHQKMLLGASKA